MPDAADLPGVNAALNAVAAALLAAGYVLIRTGRAAQHRACMLAACGVSTLFLASYVVYHLEVGSVPFTRQGPIRVVYFAVLISHVVLAALIPPLAFVTLLRALRGRFASHAALARWTLPIWLYVSVTGVAVYWMLYRL